MVSARSLLLAAFTALAAALHQCNQSITPALPQIGGGRSATGRIEGTLTDRDPGTELAAPPASLVLEKIAVGHGIQNYSCADPTGDFATAGALAVLYDVTSLYPGTAKTGITQKMWDHLPSDVLWNEPIPLNKLIGSKYGADPMQPFRQRADLKHQGLPSVKFLGHHYFDSAGIPMFDLIAARLKASVVKLNGIDAPSNADKGLIGSGAVQWLQLGESGNGQSEGLSMVYRVSTAGGGAQACSVAGVGVQSVPYVAIYWFYG